MVRLPDQAPVHRAMQFSVKWRSGTSDKEWYLRRNGRTILLADTLSPVPALPLWGEMRQGDLKRLKYYVTVESVECH
jgi:hypothetical protein